MKGINWPLAISIGVAAGLSTDAIWKMVVVVICIFGIVYSERERAKKRRRQVQVKE